MFEKIMVPLDGSRQAEDALPLALRLAMAGDARLLLLRAAPIETMLITAGLPLTPDSFEELQQSWKQATHYLDDVVAARGWSDVSIDREVHVGNPAGVIIDTAHEADVDLIIMMTRGHSRLTRWRIGSVTDQVMQHNGCPLLVLHEDKPIDRILVPLDGSALAEEALQPALALAQLLNASVTLLRVNAPLSGLDEHSLATFSHYDPDVSAAIRHGLQQRADSYLTAVAERLDQANVDRLLINGDPASSILKVAERDGYDLIAMSTHGHGAIKRFLYGSVANKVLRASNQSVLLVRPEIT